MESESVNKKSGQARRSTEPVSHRAEHHKKLVAEDAKTKNTVAVTETWYGLKQSGTVGKGKLLKYSRKQNGNVFTEYIDREDRAQDLISKLKNEGKLK